MGIQAVSGAKAEPAPAMRTSATVLMQNEIWWPQAKSMKVSHQTLGDCRPIPIKMIVFSSIYDFHYVPLLTVSPSSTAALHSLKSHSCLEMWTASDRSQVLSHIH